jgi:hypothetical protein
MNDASLDALVADLRPVRRIRATGAWLIAAIGTLFAILAVSARFVLRADLAAGHPAGLVLLRGGILLLLGCAALAAIAAAARPGVGQTSHGWRWALGAALVFPLATLVLTLVEQRLPLAELGSPSGPWCLTIGGAGALAIGTLLTLWLQRGAPVAPNRAGWLVGLGAGALGTFAYSLHCPSETIAYVGIWYSAAVGLSALAGRLIAARFLHW